jgi:hypothetical protein
LGEDEESKTGAGQSGELKEVFEVATKLARILASSQWERRLAVD